MLQVRVVKSPAEQALLFEFRYRIYVLEEAYTKDADHERKQLRDAYDDDAINYALFKEDRVVGSLRVLSMDKVPYLAPFEEKFSMGPALAEFGASSICTTSRFMIDPEFRNGKGVFKLIQRAFEDSQKRGCRLNYGDCSPHLIPFYEHLGYRRYTDGYNDSSFGYKIPIVMLIRDHQFLSQVRSILFRLVKNEQDDEMGRSWFHGTYPEYSRLARAVFKNESEFLDLLSERLAQDPRHHLVLIKGLTSQETETFFSQATLFSVKKGDLIIRKGDRDSAIYVMLKGLAEVKSDLDQQVPIAMLGAGDTFGEIGFLTSSSRTAHVIAKVESDILVLTGEFLNRIMRQQPELTAKIALNLAKELASRLAQTTSQLC